MSGHIGLDISIQWMFPLICGRNMAVNGPSVVENRNVVPGSLRSATKTGEEAEIRTERDTIVAMEDPVHRNQVRTALGRWRGATNLQPRPLVLGVVGRPRAGTSQATSPYLHNQNATTTFGVKVHSSMLTRATFVLVFLPTLNLDLDPILAILELFGIGDTADSASKLNEAHGGEPNTVQRRVLDNLMCREVSIRLLRSKCALQLDSLHR